MENIHVFERFNEVNIDISKYSVVVFFEKNDFYNKETIQNIIQRCPLSISITGYNIEYNFDYMLQLLSYKKCKHHIMTYTINSKDKQYIKKEALNYYWPEGEKFNDWHGYIFIGFK